MPKKSRNKPKVVAPLSSTRPPKLMNPEDQWNQHIDNVLDQLNCTYTEYIQPVEELYMYNTFRPSWFVDTLKQRKPIVTFMGPFSTGKSSFINYLMQKDVLLSGPQPVTDKFTVVMYGPQYRRIPGRVLLADPEFCFRGLAEFGNEFADFFDGILLPHPILRSVSLVDTPGILEAAGDMRSRRYNFIKVLRWFAEKSDLVFFMFDPTKLDAGAELQNVFKHSLRGYETKLRIVLNKSDIVRPQELMRVYGALFWNLSNLIDSTEPPRVYVSSFWDRPYAEGTNHSLFEAEKQDLLFELIETIPMQALDRRVTSLISRASDVLIFALLCGAYRSQIPMFWGKSKAKMNFYSQYSGIVKYISSTYQLSAKDFPSCEEIRGFLSKVDSHTFFNLEKFVRKGWLQLFKEIIDEELPKLLVPIKEYAIMDPRNHKQTTMLFQTYTKYTKNKQTTTPKPACLPNSFPPICQSAQQETPSSQNEATNLLAQQQKQMMQMMTAMMSQMVGKPTPTIEDKENSPLHLPRIGSSEPAGNPLVHPQHLEHPLPSPTHNVSPALEE